MSSRCTFVLRSGCLQTRTMCPSLHWATRPSPCCKSGPSGNPSSPSCFQTRTTTYCTTSSPCPHPTSILVTPVCRPQSCVGLILCACACHATHVVAVWVESPAPTPPCSLPCACEPELQTRISYKRLPGPWFNVTVNVTDSGKPVGSPLSFVALINITVIDTNGTSC